jgi:hypothetical protein
MISLTMAPKVLFDFNDSSSLENWFIVNDDVMGGQSSGVMKLNADGHGIFEGFISLENNGGFSSVRYRCGKTAVGGHSKICVRLKGDGKKYQLRIRANSEDRHSFIQPFSTSGEWEEIEVDLSEMYPTFRGRKLDFGNFSNNYFEEITFLIGNKKQERFRLLIDKIELR